MPAHLVKGKEKGPVILAGAMPTGGKKEVDALKKGEGEKGALLPPIARKKKRREKKEERFRIIWPATREQEKKGTLGQGERGGLFDDLYPEVARRRKKRRGAQSILPDRASSPRGGKRKRPLAFEKKRRSTPA